MSAKGMLSLLLEGEKLVAAFERETSVFQTELQTLREDDVVRFEVRRQELVTAVQNFDSDCTLFMGRLASPAKQLLIMLVELRQRIGTAIARVIEADNLLLALAEREKVMLETDLTAIAMGRRALCGYGTNERSLTAALNRTA
jgi:precorrin-6B methylase 2